MSSKESAQGGSAMAMARPRGMIWREIVGRPESGVVLILLAMGVFLSLYTDTFLTSTNIFNILRAFSWIAMSAFGQCMVIITAGIDLSVGSVMGLSGLASAMLLVRGVSVPVAVAGGLVTGLVVGFLNGLMITKGRLPPFIATLGTLLMARGLCYGLTGGWPVRDLPQAFRNLGQYDIPIAGFGVPLPLIFMLVLAVLTSIFLTRTIWGYRIYAVGGNETAAGLSGINTGWVKIMVYSLCGFVTAIGGVVMTARLGVAAPTAGLHFTPELLSQLEQKGVRLLFVSLHIGLDTFSPVREEDPLEHPIHSEYGILSQTVASQLSQAKREGRNSGSDHTLNSA